MSSSTVVQPPASGQPVTERLRAFFVQHCEPPRSNAPAELQQESSPQSSSARALWTQEIDCMRLLASCPELGQPMYADTLQLLNTLRTESAALCREAEQCIRPDDISIRLTHLPTLSANLPTLPPRRGQLVQVCGSIVRMSTKRVVPYAYRIMCPRCHNVVEDYTHPFDRAAQPKRKCEKTGCKKEDMQVVGQVWMDYAECRLQQRSNQSGRLPRSVLVTLDDELSTKCGVGQFVEVIGILHPTWRHLYPLSRPAIEPAIWAINVLPMEAYRGAALMAGVGSSASASANQQRRRNGQQGERPKFSPEAFFTSFLKNKRRRGVALVNSTAPQLSGLFAPRMSLLLSALNGTSMAGKTAMHIRSTIHCLFVGDPSTGKSQLLRFAASVAPRSTSTTGMGSTSAGLTVAAAKENGEWVLEPGALVLSDGGVCVIDELRTVSPADRASLHEAMEQQTISVAKGGLVTKLRTACSVLSACNPPPLKRNGRAEIGVGGPLLSRFDFIYLLWDTPQSEVDNRVADHVLSCNVANRRPDPPLMAEELARYLWWLRAQYAIVDGPFLSDTAADLLGRYYEIQRQRGASPSLEDAVPVTIRLLESLVRITQAHAKLHLQSTCTLDDAAMAIFLMERSAHSLKVPLRVLGPDVYSSTRELDELFLNDTPECLSMQEAVLEAIVEVIQHYALPGEGGPSSAPAYAGTTEHPSAETPAYPHPSISTALGKEDHGGQGNAWEGSAPSINVFSDVTVDSHLASQLPRKTVAALVGGGGEDGGEVPSSNPLFRVSQYERCQFAISPLRKSAGALGTQHSSNDELGDINYDLLTFRRQQLGRLMGRGDTTAEEGGQGSPVGHATPHEAPAAPLTASPLRARKSQEELIRESAAALQSEVNRPSMIARSVATYATSAFDDGYTGARVASGEHSSPPAKAARSEPPRRQMMCPSGGGGEATTAMADRGSCLTQHPTDGQELVRGERPMQPPPSVSPSPFLFSNVPGASSQTLTGCPPSLQQTAPFWTPANSQADLFAPSGEADPVHRGIGVPLNTQLLVGGGLAPTSTPRQPTAPPTPSQNTAPLGTQTAAQATKKRKRSAEDIMRSLRFQL